jgi:EpsI family protein
MSADKVILGRDLTAEGRAARADGEPALLSRRKLIIGLAVGGTVALSELYVPRRSVPRIGEEQFGKLIPEQLGPWRYATQSGLVLPPEDQLSRTLYEQLLTRVYTDGSDDPVMLVMAYSSVQEGRLQVHRPEVCYPAAGFSIIENSAATVPITDRFSIPVRFLAADRGARREYVMYWTRIGDSMPVRWFDQRLMMAKANLRGFIPDGLLARVSVISDDRGEAMATLTRFVQTLVADSGRAGRAMLIGPH